MRSLWLHAPDDPLAAARGDEYLWGRDILVAPVVEPRARFRHVYLPRGAWWDFWTEERVEGGREISRPVDLETLPLYVRAGAVLPMGPVKQHTAEEVEGPLTLLVFTGADGGGEVYEDDGRSFAYRDGAWMRIEASWSDADRRLSIRLAEGSRRLDPMPRRVEVRVAGEEGSREITFTGEPVDLVV
jgi:alpha-glucosidase/alpha-D-xyloside xylohydrolase